MAKFYGKIGYAESVEIRPGVWEDTMTERPYSGDTVRNNSRWNTNPDTVNDDIKLSDKLSIVADPYANQNFQQMRYVEYMGGLWKIVGVEVARPRLLLTLGGVYNGPQA